MTPAGGVTSNRNLYIGRILDAWTEEDGHGIAFDSSVGFTLPDNSMRSPDAAWVSLDRWNSVSFAERERFAKVTPEFVIELRSPSDTLPTCDRKMHIWMRNGVEVAWLIDPSARTVTIYRRGREAERFDSISQVAGEGPVAGFVLPLDRIFA